MPELIAKSPLADTAPLTLGGTTLSEIVPGTITSVAPLRGQAKALDKVLKAMGLAFPAPNRFSQSSETRLVWTGRDQAFLIGADPADLARHAALTDQSDGWACLCLDGSGAEAALARLVPVDPRPAAFPVGTAVRAPFNHMNSVLMRTAHARFEVLVFRSMARTAWHEAEAAMRALAARASIG